MKWTSRIFARCREHPVGSLVVLSWLAHCVTLSSLILLKIPSFDNSSVLLLSPSQAYLEPLIRWDAVYFLKIAQRGYAGENDMAFMPGLPLTMRWIGRRISWCRSREEVGVEKLIWAGVGSAGIASVGAVVVLYKLSIALLHDESYALVVSLLYLIPPSPATLNAVPYTEPFAAFFTFLGMLLFVKKRNLSAALVWCIGSGFRAQGIILGLGFFGWRFILGAWRDPAGRLVSRCDIKKLLAGIFIFLMLSTLSAFAFFEFEVWGYSRFCSGVEAGMRRPWCDKGLGLSYGWIQSEYWDVGLLRYWTLLQLPNFLLAAPLLALSFSASYEFYSHNASHVVAHTLPFLPSSLTRRIGASSTKGTKPTRPFLSEDLTPFIQLHTALTALLLFASHVQIILRVSAVNPVIFWYAADLLQADPESEVEEERRRGRWGKWWVGYCVVWGSVSILLWSGFYPPA